MSWGRSHSFFLQFHGSNFLTTFIFHHCVAFGASLALFIFRYIIAIGGNCYTLISDILGLFSTFFKAFSNFIRIKPTFWTFINWASVISGHNIWFFTFNAIVIFAHLLTTDADAIFSVEFKTRSALSTYFWVDTQIIGYLPSWIFAEKALTICCWICIALWINIQTGTTTTFIASVRQTLAFQYPFAFFFDEVWFLVMAACENSVDVMKPSRERALIGFSLELNWNISELVGSEIPLS